MKTIEQKQKSNERSKKWRLANPEKNKILQQNWKKANPEKVKLGNQKWAKENPKKYEIMRQKAHLKFNYSKLNFSYNDYILLNNKQKGLCAICKKPSKNKKLALDHCHDKNLVRGLLCYQCNIGIGYLKDDIDILKSAIKYLRKYEEARSK